jgi:hypothetical protein
VIYDVDQNFRGVILVRIPRAGVVTVETPTLQDHIPLLTQGRGDARQWRPDAVLGSQATWATEVADSPLADGSTAANHARNLPIPFSFDAVITDTPLIPFGSLGGLPGVRRADAILASLLDVRNSRSFVSLISPTLVLSTAMITKVDQSRGPDDGSAHYVSVTVQEIRTYAIRQLASIDDEAAQNGASRTVGSGSIVWSG